MPGFVVSIVESACGTTVPEQMQDAWASPLGVLILVNLSVVALTLLRLAPELLGRIWDHIISNAACRKFLDMEEAEEVLAEGRGEGKEDIRMNPLQQPQRIGMKRGSAMPRLGRTFKPRASPKGE